MRNELESVPIPGEDEARGRAWEIVSAAFAEREPTSRRRSWKPVVALVGIAVVVAGLLSPPGRAVLDELRDAVGVEKAQPALFSLPAPGRLLVLADSGAWVVAEDGSKRRLGPYREASWSPFGRFVAASRRNELVALTPGGRRALVDRAAGCALPPLGRVGDGHADRVPLERQRSASSAATGGATASSTSGPRRGRRPGARDAGTCSCTSVATARCGRSTSTPARPCDLRGLYRV